MITITVIFLGDMERLAGTDSKQIELAGPARLDDVARAAGIEDDSLLMVLNGKTAAPEAIVNDGDEVAFFPRVGGGAT